MNDAELIWRALDKAAVYMGLSKKDVDLILTANQSTLSRNSDNHDSRELAGLIFLDIYRKLFSKSFNNNDFPKHFLYTDNKYFSAKPIDILKSKDGLQEVNDFLVAMSSKQ